MLCNNTYGSFFCDCLLGYELDVDNKSCNGKDFRQFFHYGLHFTSFLMVTDIDECALNISSCVDDAGCLNGNGSYNCTCNSGFYGNGFINCLSN